MASDDLIYAPAVRGNVGVLLMLAGGSGSGKTKSALRLAVGLANGGTIGFCDTEHGRARYYADEFNFQHLALKEPFNPKRFEDAAVKSQSLGHAVWICDSFSHEHVGPGGVLDMQEAELQRMTRGDFSKRDALKYTSWIAPKMEHKHMLQRLWQLNCHIILCCHAEKKLELIKDNRGRNVPNPDATPSPVCAPDIPYAMTCSFMLDAKQPGVPRWLKPLDKLMGMVDLDRPLDEETGARIAAWARGDAVPDRKPATAKVQSQPAQAAPSENPGPPADDVDDPEDVALSEALVELFLDAEDLKRHLELVDANQPQFAWLKRNSPKLWKRIVEPAVKASAVRNQTARAETTKPPAGTAPAAATTSPDEPAKPVLEETRL